MADDPPPSSPSLFDQLPVELLKRIVEDVHQQDEAFQMLYLKRAPHEKETLEGLSDDEDILEEEEEEEEDNAGGRWSSAYGRGVRALSRLNRTLRTLTGPYLFETVTSAQLDHLYFRSHILGRPLASLIKHVDLSDGGEDKVIAATWTLQHLPSVTSVTLSGEQGYELLEPVMGLSRIEARDPSLVARETARLEFHNFLRRIPEVRLVDTDTDTTLYILGSPPIQASTRRLKFVNGYFDLSAEKRLWEVLQALDLEALEIDQACALSGLDIWAHSLRLPSLASLTVPLALLGRDPLSLLQTIAPNLVSLDLTVSPFASDLTSSVSFPRLTHLALAGTPSSLSLVSLFSSSPLRTLEFRCRSGDSGPLADVWPSFKEWPATLRRFYCEVSSRTRPVAAESFIADLRHNGMDVSFIWRPGTDAYVPDILRTLQSKAEVVEDDLRWAMSEVEALRAAGDEEGMREFAQAVTRVREKRALKMS